MTLCYNVDGGSSGLLGHGPSSCEQHSVANRKRVDQALQGLGQGKTTLSGFLS